MFSMFTKRLGIDLGTANSVVWFAGTGVVLNEPTVVAVTADDGRVVAVGNEAKEMLGRTPGNITASRPMRDGVIADYRITEAMLRYFIDRAVGRNRIVKPEVMICVPTGASQVERRAVVDATLAAGSRVAYLIEEPLAAAIGAKIPIAQPSGHMIVDIGGGSTEAAVISLGGVVVHKSARVAGNKIDEAIANYVKKQHNLIIGTNSTEENRELKPRAVYVYDIKEDRNYPVGDAALFTPAPKPTPTPKTKTKTADTTPTEPQLTLKWLPSSRHLVFVAKEKVQIMDYDGSNVRTAYAGPFWDSFAVPWASGGKLVILTNLNSGAAPANNLYVVNLR